MTYPTDTDRPSPTIEQARQELRKGIEASREIVRKSQALIALSEAAPPFAANDNPSN